MNHGYTYVDWVGHRDHGADLCGWLAARHGHSDVQEWSRRIGSGELAIDGVVVARSRAVSRGERVAWTRPPWEEPEVPRDVATCFVDDHVLVVAKPSGLPTLPGGGFLENTLLSIVRATWPEATPMHRLGRGTSGLVLFARSPRARSTLQADWRAGRVAKVYRALASGSPAWDEIVIDVGIGPVAHARLGAVHAARTDGLPSRSRARVLERRADAAIVEVTIETGRPHQIRIHLAAAGHPLVGDPLYGPGGLPRSEALPGDLGYLLHAGLLGFTHPVSGVPMEVTAAAPGGLRPGPAAAH